MADGIATTTLRHPLQNEGIHQIEYLADYFNAMRNQLDKEIVMAKKLNQSNQENRTKLDEIWHQIDEKIGSLEQKSTAEITYSEMETDRLDTNVDGAIDSTESNLLNSSNLEQVQELRESEYLKKLFKNKTIAFIKVNDQNKSKLINYKLIVINDTFIQPEAIKKRQLVQSDQIDLLDTQLLKTILLERKLNSSQAYILEECLNMSLLKELRLDSLAINQVGTNTFEQLNQLETLYLNQNQLTRIVDGTFQTLKNLHHLDLDSNLLHEINSSTFLGLNNLKILNLNGNQLVELKEMTFQSLTSLEILYLNVNKIFKINANAFQGLKNLKKLTLWRNKISEIDAHAFQGLDKLVGLFLSSNQINEMDADVFQGLSGLLELDLRTNQISHIDANVFSNLDRLETLHMQSNRLSEEQKMQLKNKLNSIFDGKLNFYL